MLTDTDHAKYPFTTEAARYVSGKGLKIQDLVADISFEPVLDRAEKRIEEAIISAKVSQELQNNPDWDILSFPTAIMFVSILGDDRLRRRYALAESERAYEFLRKDALFKIIEIAENTFGWKIRLDEKKIEGRYYEYALHFINYLRNATSIHQPEWKLTNRILSGGYVYLTKDQTSRLLREEIQRKILDRCKKTVLEIPALAPRIKGIKQMIEARKGFMRMEEVPRAAVYTAMPPCVRNLYDALFAGRNLSHMGRFTLTSFLVNVGVGEEDIVKTFKAATDFDEKKTRYQVEHIAGRRGGKRKYTPPRCETLKTHGAVSYTHLTLPTNREV